ncbi:LysR family transcriptional regulator [Lysinibacillus capsici]|uniref:LysR family transcriptional regulator n=1 Tax=Lysinibacillus capsici TaxID=2115968 RepID=UPI0029DE7109|nr:LysR family transcriptional regulator [Lysinibacillus capsici]WPK07498.1 LysR family transcriptional regulator [Lysinibacillus capsici]
MEWHHFEYFQVLAETEHMTKAAERLAVSQSALSRAIAKLEQELGCTLFERRGRTIRLNKYGEAFLARTKKIIYEMKAGKEELQEMMEIERGTLTLGFLHTIGSTYLPNYIRLFKQQFPHVHLKLIQNNSHILLGLLKQGLLDICLISTLEMKEETIQWLPLMQERLYITLSIHHPLSNREEIYLDEVQNEMFIVLKEGFSLRNTINNIFEQVNIQPKISFEGEEVQTIASLVAVGLGISILPHLKNAREMGIIQFPITEKNVFSYRMIGLSWPNKAFETRLFNEVRNSLIDYFKSL